MRLRRGRHFLYIMLCASRSRQGYIGFSYFSTNSDHAMLSLFFFFCLEYIASIEQNTAVMQQNIVIEKPLKAMIIILIAEINTATKDMIQANKVVPGTNME